MPRGLGDNPLKRERASRRKPRAADEVRASEASAVQPPGETLSAGVAGDHSTSSRSYNDVFFQRIPEAEAAAAPVPAIEEVTVAAPAPETVSLPEPAVTTTMALSETVVPAGPLATVEVAPAPPPVTEASPAAVEQQTTPVQAQQQKSGFFGRVFGRFRKS